MIRDDESSSCLQQEEVCTRSCPSCGHAVRDDQRLDRGDKVRRERDFLSLFLPFPAVLVKIVDWLSVLSLSLR